MAITYFPRLSESNSIPIIERMLDAPLDELTASCATSHPMMELYETAINSVDESTLAEFRKKAFDAALKYGFPEPCAKTQRASGFDRDMATLLFEDLELVLSEAAHNDVWNFLTLVVLPDLAKWRYPNNQRKLTFDRWLGTHRNVFRKLWWREATLGHQLNSQIGEDEAVAIMERPFLSGQAGLARSMVRALLNCEKQFPHIARSSIMRNGAMRIRSLAPIIAFEVYSEAELDALVEEIFITCCTNMTPNDVAEGARYKPVSWF